MYQSDDLAWVALSLQPHIGSKTLSQLIAQFGSAGNVVAADETSLRRVRGVGPKLAKAIIEIDLDRVAKDCERWSRTGVQIVPHYHAHYPQRLRQLEDAPATIFIKGHIFESLPDKTVAIVGTRHPSEVARKAAYQLGQLFTQAGYLIVSGMALGIDAAAHQAALGFKATVNNMATTAHTEHGATVAVLGSGVLNPYPAQHRTLAQQIIQQGALMSECAPDAATNAPRLVSRNRLITGLAQTVIIVETSEDGGAMHAARFAKSQGRKLYVLDLPTSGNQALIHDGAQPIHVKIETLDFLLCD